ncbi:hypothetical protein [Streptomyces sp. NPDC020965]|uniref:hypothetical protein n=1 Tax=Streptomyces sp. NPDC020965 TaxID=3365105 RepID=UPI0037B63A32
MRRAGTVGRSLPFQDDVFYDGIAPKPRGTASLGHALSPWPPSTPSELPAAGERDPASGGVARDVTYRLQVPSRTGCTAWPLLPHRAVLTDSTSDDATDRDP